MQQKFFMKIRRSSLNHVIFFILFLIKKFDTTLMMTRLIYKNFFEYSKFIHSTKRKCANVKGNFFNQESNLI